MVFSDAVYMFLRRNKISEEMIAKLHEYVKEEEYETDTICLDINYVGNIANHMNDQKCILWIRQFIQAQKRMLLPFMYIDLHNLINICTLITYGAQSTHRHFKLD